jgi:hypothetical protein
MAKELLLAPAGEFDALDEMVAAPVTESYVYNPAFSRA